jgi:hypothetical protein
MNVIDTIQFKHVVNYEGSFADSVKNIKSLGLKPGEPLLCSYKDAGGIKTKYFLAIGARGNFKIFPSFDDMNEVINFIKSHSTGINLENTSEDSDVTVTIDEDNKYVFKLKDELKGNNN